MASAAMRSGLGGFDHAFRRSGVPRCGAGAQNRLDGPSGATSPMFQGAPAAKLPQVRDGTNWKLTRRGSHWLAWVLVLFLAPSAARGQERAHPLQPPDRSSPRATLKTFLDSTDAIATFLAQEYIPSPTLEEFLHLRVLAQTPVGCLDLGNVAPSARWKSGNAATLALYETLSKIDLPAWEAIPGADQQDQSAGTDLERWVIPHTEITLTRVPGGSSGGEFLFSPETVAKAESSTSESAGWPIPVRSPLEHARDCGRGGGWLVPYAWIQAMPAWLRARWPARQPGSGSHLALILGFFRCSCVGSTVCRAGAAASDPFLRALAQMALPAFFLAATPAIASLALVQLNLRGGAASAIELVATAVMFLAGAWISWRFAPVVAEAIIASPRIPPESVDAHLIRICTRLLGMVAAGRGCWPLGADRLGNTGVWDRCGAGRRRLGHRPGRAADRRESDRRSELVCGQAHSGRRFLPVRDVMRDGRSHRHPLDADSGRRPHADDDSQRGALEDVDRELRPARPDADPVRHRRSLRDQPGATALFARQDPGNAPGPSAHSP